MKYLTFFAILLLFIVLPNRVLAQGDPFKLSGEYSSNFGQFTIVVTNNKITGLYEYYEQYDEKVKGYLRENIFFLKGTSVNGKDFSIISTDPGFPGDIQKGRLSFLNGKLKIVLTGTPPMDAGFDIDHESDKSYFPFVKPNKYLLLTFIKSKRAYLYNLNGDNFTIRKGYLVSNEFVKVVEKKDNFSKVLYQPVTDGKIYTYWVSNQDLLDPTADNWNGFVK